ncbi:hypothetical protein PoB_002797700 [Plakobranchus ocellatus]|uniref:SWIM-type domain-containing protein n=1 Tax=Plakobranchus ocellatus TaxID=259542 RepID=A0AAV4A3N2_9GAST|nr:hypothetical protein PoB_002797700 [Plakobranchus ocellatus]
MYKCKTEEQYSSLKNSIMNLSFQFHDYFMKNWDSEKEKWVGCHLNTKLTYGNLTNNIVESHNQKIKSAVNQNSSLCDLLRNLLTLSKMTAQKTSARVSKLKLKKRQYVGNQVPVNLLNTINMMCTPHASAIIRAEMDKSYNEIFIVQENCVFEKGKAFHLDLLLKRCSCYISTYQRLPCRHLMSYRKDNGGEIIEEADIPDHYNLQKYLNSFCTDQPVSCSTQNVAVLPLHNRILNATEKYNIAKRVLSGICDVLAQMGQKQFERCFDMYRTITER